MVDRGNYHFSWRKCYYHRWMTEYSPENNIPLTTCYPFLAGLKIHWNQKKRNSTRGFLIQVVCCYLKFIVYLEVVLAWQFVVVSMLLSFYWYCRLYVVVLQVDIVFFSLWLLPFIVFLSFLKFV